MRDRLSRGIAPWALCVLGGTLGFLGYVGFGHFYLNWVFLVPVLWVTRDASLGRTFLLGWVAGAVGHGGGFHWMVHLLRDFGDVDGFLAVLGTAGIGIYHGASLGLWALLTRIVTRVGGWSTILVAPAVWVLVERAYPFLFPMYLGAGQYHLTPLVQIADLTGPLGLSFLVVWGNATIYEICLRRTRGRPLPLAHVAALAGAIVLVLAYGYVRIGAVERAVADAAKLDVGIVQTNLGAAEKSREPLRFFRRHREMTRELEREHDLDLIVWPESVVSVSVGRNGALQQRVFGNGETPLLLGAVMREREGDRLVPYSGALLLGPGERILGRYDKRRLVPFGEYVPFAEWLPFLDGWSPHQGNYASGTSLAPIPFGGYRLSASVCYEDIFAGDVRALMNGGDPDDPPHLLVNLTNDSWYGDSIEPLQHLVLASLRCIEHRRAMVRATNTGISALIDPLGRFQKRTPQWEEATLVGTVPLLEGRTVYGRLGDWPFHASALGVAVALFVGRRRRSRAAR